MGWSPHCRSLFFGKEVSRNSSNEQSKSAIKKIGGNRRRRQQKQQRLHNGKKKPAQSFLFLAGKFRRQRRLIGRFNRLWISAREQRLEGLRHCLTQYSWRADTYYRALRLCLSKPERWEIQYNLDRDIYFTHSKLPPRQINQKLEWRFESVVQTAL